MSVASRKANRALQLATEGVADRVYARAADVASVYARDPFKHLEEGHIVVQDLESLRPVPFDPWPHQEDLIADWIDLDYLAKHGRPRLRNVFEEKSRRMGVTWIIAYCCWWLLRWHDLPGMTLALKVNDIADPGFTVDSFMGRIKFIAEYRPLRPEDPPGMPEQLRSRMTFVGGNEPSIRSASTGYLAGFGAVTDPGRGAGYGYAFLDEFARTPFGRAVQAAVTRACPTGRLYTSTPDGEDNEFYAIKKRRPEGYVMRRDHWTKHPVFGKGKHIAGENKTCSLCAGNRAGIEWRADQPRAHRYPGRMTSEWYDEATVELDDEQVAAELEIDYAAALTARVYPEFTEERHVAAIVIPRVMETTVELGWDYGVDTTAVVVCQDTPREYRVLAEIEIHDTLPEQVSAQVRRVLREIGFTDTELLPELTRRLPMVGDPAGEIRDLATGRPLVDDYRQQGFSINSTPRRVATTIRAVKRLLNGRPKELVVSQRCPLFISHMKHNRWPVDRRGNRKPDAAAPQNDDHNHMMRAFAYLIADRFPVPDGEQLRPNAQRARAPVSGRLDEGLGYDERL